MTEPRPVVLLRVHRRADYLGRILAQAARLGADVFTYADRPTPEVLAHIQHRAHHITAEPLVSQHGERFMEALIEHHALALERYPDATHFMLWDDDMLLDEVALQETLDFIASGAPGCLRLRSRFHWGQEGQVNDGIPEHWAHWAWKHKPGVTYTTRRMVHAPERIALDGPVADMAGWSDNYGYLDPAERARTWAAFKRAGKIDPHTLAFAPCASPKLRQLSR